MRDEYGKVVREKHNCDIHMVKAIYSTIHSMTSLDEEVRKDTREIWHVAGVYVERTIFVSPRLYVYVILIVS